MKTVGEMTMQELTLLIEETIESKLAHTPPLLRVRPRTTWAEAAEIMRRVRWTPPAGAPSSVELLREDREQ